MVLNSEYSFRYFTNNIIYNKTPDCKIRTNPPCPDQQYKTVDFTPIYCHNIHSDFGHKL